VEEERAIARRATTTTLGNIVFFSIGIRWRECRGRIGGDERIGARTIGKNDTRSEGGKMYRGGWRRWSRSTLGPPLKGGNYKDPNVHCLDAVTRGLRMDVGEKMWVMNDLV